MSMRFNRPDISNLELAYAEQCLRSASLSGDGAFTKSCHELLENIYGTTVLLTHSCTAALEMAAILAELRPGDEVIMPSFTFVSTANAVVLRGAVPVFVDIRPDTLNMDEAKIVSALTPRTRAIVPVHYAGVGCEMDTIMAIAQQHGLTVIEDAAQGYGATYQNRPLGTLGQFGCLSFHETKNIVSGEGGALIVNDPEAAARAHHIREKGTNRREFMRREVKKYEWIDIGSSFLPSDLLAAVLLAQLERAQAINARRLEIWGRFHDAFADLDEEGLVRRPAPPPFAAHNGHIYYLIGRELQFSQKLMDLLRGDGIPASSHYVPLHSSPAGLRYGKVSGRLSVTESVSANLIRLPIHATLTDEDVAQLIDRTRAHICRAAKLASL
jgi:dTDP-4-amino-4,6-dideoxygalactose transaminase